MEIVNIQKHISTENLIDEVGLLLLLHPHLLKQQPFTLTSRGEGFSFAVNGLYKFLDQVCNFFKFPKNKIFIQTWNLLEKHKEYNIVIKKQIYDCHYFKDPDLIKYPTDKKIGVFLGRANYTRLTFHSKLKNIDWRHHLIYTFHTDLMTDPWPTGLKKVLMNGDNYKFFKDTLPHSDIKDEIKSLPIIPPENIFNLKKVYETIIFEIVFETLYQNGFFVTEKTLRPIFYGRPFIVVGPPNFEKNMEKLGFNLNFNFPFNLETFHSVEKINAIFDIIHTWFLRTDLEIWFQSIIPILEHNQSVLKKYADNNGHIDKKIINQLN